MTAAILKIPSISEACNFFIFASLIFLIIFTPLTFGAVETWSIMTMELCILFMVLCWFLKMLHKGELSFVKNPIVLLIACFIGLILFSLIPLPKFSLALLSPNTVKLYTMSLGDLYSSCRSISVYKWQTAFELHKVLAYIGVFFIILNNMRHRKEIDRIVICIIAVGTFLAMVGVAERYGPGKIVFLRTGFGEDGFFGLFVNKNHLAGYLEMVIPLAIAKTFIDSKNIRGILWGFASCLMLSQLFLTYSRAGIISFSMSFLMCIVLLSVLGMRKEKRYKRHFFIILVCLAITLLMVASALKITTNHMNNTLQTDLSTRLQLYKDIFRLIQRFPIFGVGLGNFQTVFPIYQSFAYRSIFIYAHNDYLQLFSELGIFGFIIVFCGGFYFFKGVLSAILESYNRNPESDRYVVSLLFGCLAGFLSISFHSLLDFNMQIPANALLFTIIISITLKLIIKEHGEVEDKNDYKVTKALIGRNRIIAYFSFPALMIYALFPIRVFLTNTFAEKIKEETKPISVSIDLEKPLHLSSGNSELYYHLADLYEASGDKHTAIRNYMRSIKLNPLNSKYHFRLGLISGVQRDFERATLLNPAGEDIYYETGVFYLKGHQPIKGAEQFKKALSLSTHYEEAIFDQIWGSSAVFDHDKYKVMAEVIPDSPEAKAKLARYLKDKQLWDESEREYRVAIDMANGKEKLRYMADFAHNFLMRGRRRFGDAKEIWLKYIALNDTNIHAFFNLGRCYEYEGELDKAAEFYAYAIQMAPERVYYDKLAQVLFRKGDYEGAIETWQECIKISPNFSPAYYGIGESYNKLEQFNRALFYYQETLRLKPDGKDILQKIESIR